MLIQSLWSANPASQGCRIDSNWPPVGNIYDDAVSIRLGQKQGDPSVITINCLDQLGLGCDLTRIVLEFGFSVVRADFSTDGSWCFIIFWVKPMQDSHRSIKWAMLKKRLIAACPSNRARLLLPLITEHKQEDIYVLQARSSDRTGLLNDVAQTLWELELAIHRVKVTTSPDGNAINLFYISDIKKMLRNKKRQDDICYRIRNALGELSSCELQLAGPQWGRLDCMNSPSSVTEDLLGEGLTDPKPDLGSIGRHGAVLQDVCVGVDNSLSPAHTLLQISCKDRKGLLYDVMRTLKDLNLQIAYGRVSTTSHKIVEIELFILQADGRKIVDPQMQKALCTRLEMEIANPIRVMLVSRGPDTEVLVATPVEAASDHGRPQALFDITLALKMLNICIFKAESGRQTMADSQREIHRFLLIDKPELKLTSTQNRTQIAARIRKALMG